MFFNYPVNYVKIKSIEKNILSLGWDREYGGPNVPIYACFTGVVINTLESSNNEKRVVIKYEDEEKVYYAKYTHFSNVLVSKNDEVNIESILGLMGKNMEKETNELSFCLYVCPLNTEFSFSKDFHDEYIVNPIDYLYIYSHQSLASENDNTRYLISQGGIDTNILNETEIINYPSSVGEIIRIITKENNLKIYAKCGSYFQIDKDAWINKSDVLYKEEEKYEKEKRFDKIIQKVKKIFLRN